MGIAGLSLPNTASMENLHGGGQSHPFNSAGAMQPATPCVISSMLFHSQASGCDTLSATRRMHLLVTPAARSGQDSLLHHLSCFLFPFLAEAIPDAL